MSVDIKDHLAQSALVVEKNLEGILSADVLDGEVARPDRLLEAMRYAVLGGGKRLRPVLLMEAAALFGRHDDGIVLAGAALELIHCYSLVHDDLPAMDDDDLRRGRPTVHRAFDEATAVLAGDALLTLAFDCIVDDRIHAESSIRLNVVREYSRASGLGGMAGGQMLDLESENRNRTEAEIRLLQSMKTGALLRCACRSGALLAKAANADVERLTRFGETIGLMFQLADDLLDVEACPEKTGKATGKDLAAGKATLVGLLGVEATRIEIGKLVKLAQELMTPYGAAGERLVAIASFIAERDH